MVVVPGGHLELDAASLPGTLCLCQPEGGSVRAWPVPVVRLAVAPLTRAERLSALRSSFAFVELPDHPVGPATAEPAELAEVARDLSATGALAGSPVTSRDVVAALDRLDAAGAPDGAVVVHPAAGFEDLVVTEEVAAQLHEALDRQRHRETVLERWGFLAGRPGRAGLRLLFHGPPGTGKTLAGEVLAGALGRDLLVVDLSRIVSKWLGETEKQLAATFERAERTGCALFFDEADALFGRRTEVGDARDRYANLETAYLLSRIERFEGLVVLATNLRQNLDGAFTRRLDVVIGFDPPDAAQRLALWSRLLPPGAPLEGDVDLQRARGALRHPGRIDPRRGAVGRVPRRCGGRRDRHAPPRARVAPRVRQGRPALPRRAAAPLATTERGPMSPPTTLTAYYEEASTDAANAVNAAQTAVGAATTNLTSAQVALATAAATLAADQAATANARIQLAQAALPSDATYWVGQLQASLIRTRIDQAALEAATDAANVAARAQASASANLPTAQLAAQQAAAALAASQASDVQVAQWTAAVQGPAVTAALAQANDPSLTTLHTDATNAIEAIIGSGMLALFRQRRDDFLAAQSATSGALGRAVAASNSLLSSHEPLVAAVAQAEVTYDADLAGLQRVASNAVSDVAAIVATFTSAANVGSLPGDEQSALNTAFPAASSEIGAEANVFGARSQLRNDEASLDSTALGNYQTNPDFDPDTDPSTTGERDAIGNDQSTLGGDQSALNAVVASIDNWEVLIPDSVLSLAVGVVEAETTLAFYQTVDVSTLLSNLANDEATYAGALDALLTYRRSRTLLAGIVATRQADLTAANQVAPAREDSAIRGTW